MSHATRALSSRLANIMIPPFVITWILGEKQKISIQQYRIFSKGTIGFQSPWQRHAASSDSPKSWSPELVLQLFRDHEGFPFWLDFPVPKTCCGSKARIPSWILLKSKKLLKNTIILSPWNDRAFDDIISFVQVGKDFEDFIARLSARLVRLKLAMLDLFLNGKGNYCAL